MSRRSRRTAAVLLAAAAAVGLSVASAAQLSVGTATLGAGTSVVGTCQPAGTPITVTFLSTFVAGQYMTTDVRVSGVAAACGGRSAKVQVLATDGSPLGAELAGPVPHGGGSWTIPIPHAPASAVGGLAGVIHD